MNLDAILNYTGEGPASLEHTANMALSPGEVQLAHTIKEAVEAEPTLQNISDFDYVQFALAAKGASLQLILAKVATIQSFRHEYHLEGSVEEAMYLMDQFTQNHPGFLLDIDYQPYYGNFNIIQDVAAFVPARIQTLDQMKVFMAGFYYRFHAVNCTFRSIREGCTTIFECEGCTFDRNFDSHVIEKICYEVHRPYPTLLKTVHFVNSPTVINVIVALLKTSLPKHHTNAIHLGSHVEIPGFEGRRLDELFMAPTFEQARRSMLTKIERYLRMRAHHQTHFRLPA